MGTVIAAIVGAIITAGVAAYAAFKERKSGIENAGKLSETSTYIASEQEAKQDEKIINDAKDAASNNPNRDLRNW